VQEAHFSAYLKSPYIGALHRDNRLELAELVPNLAKAVEEARQKIKDLFRERASERARIVVEDWKAQNVYPYQGEASTQIERAERQIFDIVAVTVREATPDFTEIPRPQVALHLRMLRHAIERSPTELQRILDEVLRLSKRKQKELAVLLDETDLSAIISAATMIADRLKFLQGLRVILFEHEAKQRLKERSQLHKILETNTWIFGEEFNLWASDRELTTVLRTHKEKLDPELIIDEPVKLMTRKRGIVDLMLSRSQKRHRADDYEHLVVELKAPKVKITSKELTQIKDYALSVSRDPRYHRVSGVRWHFWIVSDEYDDFVQSEINSGPDPERRLALNALMSRMASTRAACSSASFGLGMRACMAARAFLRSSAVTLLPSRSMRSRHRSFKARQKRMRSAALIGSGKAAEPRRAMCSLTTLPPARRVPTRLTTSRWRTARKRTNIVWWPHSFWITNKRGHYGSQPHARSRQRRHRIEASCVSFDRTLPPVGPSAVCAFDLRNGASP
jgi:hypothetical protein